MESNNKEYQKGLIYILLVYVIWGFMPAYWKLMKTVDPVLILAHRVVWAFVLLIIAMLLLYKPSNLLEPLKDKKNIFLFICASITLAGQWIFYILCIVTNHVAELSLGYYIYPIIVVIFSAFLFKEKTNIYTKIAFVLALAGVLIMIIGYNNVPALGLGVAVTFSLYSVVKKKLRVMSLFSTFYELLFLLPFALVYIFYMEINESGRYFANMANNVSLPLLLIGGGVSTCITLLLFASGAKRLNFAAVGFLQYISPTMVIVLALAVYKEAFGPGEWISYGFIWIAVIVYSIPAIKELFFKKNV
ncbi:MAG: EamA family transporter RarD [Clostridiales bacterium]|nr:EamA family transporter RarD [Clostridiales bacterium]